MLLCRIVYKSMRYSKSREHKVVKANGGIQSEMYDNMLLAWQDERLYARFHYTEHFVDIRSQLEAF